MDNLSTHYISNFNSYICPYFFSIKSVDDMTKERLILISISKLILYNRNLDMSCIIVSPNSNYFHTLLRLYIKNLTIN